MGTIVRAATNSDADETPMCASPISPMLDCERDGLCGCPPSPSKLKCTQALSKLPDSSGSASFFRGLDVKPQSKLSVMGEDEWYVLAMHLDLPALHALSCSSRNIRKLICALLPSLLHAVNPSHDDRRNAVDVAIVNKDAGLAHFALFGPTLTAPASFSLIPADDNHPLFRAYNIDVLSNAPTLPILYMLLRAYLCSGGSLAHAIEPSRLAQCQNDGIIRAMIDCFAQSSEIHGDDRPLQQLVFMLSYSGRIPLVHTVLLAYPRLASAQSTCKNCQDCKGMHSLLHAAAEKGCCELVRLVVAAWRKDNMLPSEVARYVSGINMGAEFLSMRNCVGESALAVAVRYRRKKAVRELIRYGADIGDLARCAALTCDRRFASKMWYESQCDVD